MKTFVVNLAKHIDRMASIDSQLKNLGIEYERIEAVYGKALSKMERRRDYRLFRAWLIYGRALSDGALGCSLSHVAIYKKMVEQNIEKALILEDDVLIDSCANSVIARVDKFLDVKRKQAITFNAHGVKSGGDVCRGDVVPVNGFSCTDMYAITLPAAAEILRVNYPVSVKADGWARWHRFFGLELYRAYPTVARQDNERFGTEIARWTSVGYERSYAGFKLFWHKMKRLVGCPLDNILLKFGL